MREHIFSFIRWASRKLYGRNLGRLFGVRTLHAFLIRTFKPHSLTLVPVQGGGELWVDPTDDGEAKELILYGTYAPFLTSVIEKYIKPGMIAVDIGAHIGCVALVFSRSVGGNGRIYAFEPEPHNFELLGKNVAHNRLNNVIPVRSALGEREGSVPLYLDTKNFGNMSLSRANIPNDSVGREVTVPMTTADNYFQALQVDFIKMDVQGAEGIIIKGGRNVFRNASYILFEFWPSGLENMGTNPVELLQDLRRMGFFLYIVDERKKVLRKKGSDDISGIRLNRPDGKGWTNILCTRMHL